MKRILAAAAAVALLSISTTFVHAQSEHEGHHGGTEAPAPASAPTQERTKEGTGMMGGGNMPMMKDMQDMHEKMMSGNGRQPKGDTGPSSQALNGVIARMQNEMVLPYSGDTDVDFAKRMLSHHQGAIDMAKVELAFGKDAEARKVAESIIKENEAGIGALQQWLKAKGK